MDYNIWVADAAEDGQRIYKLASVDSPKKYQLLLTLNDPMNPPPIYIHVIRNQLKKYFASVDETKVSIKPYSSIINGRTMVPLRWIAENVLTNKDPKKGVTYECKVDWNDKTRCATFTLDKIVFSDKLVYPKTVVTVCLNNPVGSINGKPAPIDSTNPKVKPENVNDRTMVPARFIEEAFGAEVRFKTKNEMPKTPNDEVIFLMPSTIKVKEAYGTK